MRASIPSFVIFSVLSSSFLATQAFGWGDTGHRTVGQIASRHLTAKAGAAVRSLLGTETLAKAATWADEVRSEAEYKIQDPWHFVEIPMGENYDPAKASPKGDIIQALQKARLDLLDPSAKQETKKKALRLLAHFMGDLHQPLHVGNGVDAGANLCSVSFLGDTTNLHSLWDDGMINSTKLSYTEFANFLDTSSAKEVVELGAGSFLDWAAESSSVRESIYPISVGSTKKSETPAERTYCRKDFPDPYPARDLVPKLSFDYRHQQMPMIEKRIRLAGYRLAAQLNEIFR